MTLRPARKRFGQNFLHNQALISQMIAAINPQQGDNLVEIGPGRGALTLGLLHGVKILHALELDRDLIKPLQALCQPHGQLKLKQEDALRFDFSTLVTPPNRLRVVGNLPYNISTPLLFHLFDQTKSLLDMHFLLQKEVVARMAAVPGNKTYGRLSVMTQFMAEVQPLFTVPPEAFTPIPRVDSTFVRLRPYQNPPVLVQNTATLAKVVTQAFSQRRKTLRNALKSLLNTKQISALNIDPSSRAECLDVQAFARLSNALD